jgi:cell division protein FtsL
MMIMPGMGLSEMPTVNELGTFMIIFAIIVAALGAIALKHACRLLTITKSSHRSCSSSWGCR